MGVVCIVGAILIPIAWMAAVISTDPEFTMSDAEAVFAYTMRHTKLSAEQENVLNDAVIYAHGSSHIVRFLPWCLPLVLFVSGIVHLRSSAVPNAPKA